MISITIKDDTDMGELQKMLKRIGAELFWDGKLGMMLRRVVG